jgi:hypothetical protein
LLSLDLPRWVLSGGRTKRKNDAEKIASVGNRNGGLAFLVEGLVLAQFFEAVIDPVFDEVFWNPKHLGYFGARQSFGVTQQ